MLFHLIVKFCWQKGVEVRGSISSHFSTQGREKARLLVNFRRLLRRLRVFRMVAAPISVLKSAGALSGIIIAKSSENF
jgi:RNase P/RNase MRP subunit p30